MKLYKVDADLQFEKCEPPDDRAERKYRAELALQSMRDKYYFSESPEEKKDAFSLKCKLFRKPERIFPGDQVLRQDKLTSMRIQAN